MSSNLAALDVDAATPAKPASNYRYMAIFLIAMAITVNYIDRVNIAVATPTLMTVLGLSASQMGVLMSAFFWSYTLMMIPVGALLNKFGPKMLMFYSCLGWGLVTVMTSLVNSFGSFLAVRIGLGITEAPSYPAAPRVVSVWVPKRERTMASACFDCCARVGNAFAPPLVALIIVTWGWKASFVVSGMIAVVYSFVWLYLYKDPDEHPKVTDSELAYIRQDEVLTEEGQVVVKPIPLAKLFTYRVILQLCGGYALYMYFWTTFNSWIPAYMMNVCGLSLKSMGFAAMFPYIAGVSMELLGGFVFDRWFRRGATITAIRRTGMGVGMIGGAIALYLATHAAASSPAMAIFWLTCSMGIFSFGASNVWAIPTDVAPYGQAGGVGGVYSFVGNFGSLLGPIVTGIIVDTAFGYNGALIVMCILSALGALLYMTCKYERLEPTY
ncbi:putative galactarate transporter [Pelotomaculum schinkii]|uniref:Putative galactarate transporter n=1 Tax=Pelotomaculum schinkii TaxID=78350 RepID=A0A4Y7RF91_9FIRM|nr:MFS transporter [Pelotomaculum schinkii]TEB07453.1 putative galactarate transporter [Pelotomaculum schinkii]